MSKDGVHNLSSATEFKSNLREAPEGKLAVLDCFATWCGPCKVIAPKIVEFSEKYPDVSFYKIDVDEQAEVAAELGVRAMPTFFFFKNGEIIADVVGANPAAVEAAIKANM